MRLTSSELGALELGLAMLRAERPPDERKAVNGALERLRKAMVNIPSDAVAASKREASLPSSGDPSTLAAVQHAMTARRRIRIRYRGGSKVEASERTVSPYALVVASGSWYALAHCESSNQVKSFRLDRIEAVEQTAESYEIPGDVLGGRASERSQSAASRASRGGCACATRRGSRGGLPSGRESSRSADGSLTMEHPLLDVQWGVRHVLQYGPDAEVLEPAEVREELRRRVAGLVAT